MHCVVVVWKKRGACREDGEDDEESTKVVVAVVVVATAAASVSFIIVIMSDEKVLFLPMFSSFWLLLWVLAGEVEVLLVAIELSMDEVVVVEALGDMSCNARVLL